MLEPTAANSIQSLLDDGVSKHARSHGKVVTLFFVVGCLSFGAFVAQEPSGFRIAERAMAAPELFARLVAPSAGKREALADKQVQAWRDLAGAAGLMRTLPHVVRARRPTANAFCSFDRSELKRSSSGPSFRRGLYRDAAPTREATRVLASELEYTEENVEMVCKEVTEALDAIFDNPKNRAVGITGKLDFVELDGLDVIVGLRGRFWHKRVTVLERVASFLKNRIPEIECVKVVDPAMIDEANNVYEEGEILKDGLPADRDEDGAF